MRKPTIWVPTKNRAVQSQKMIIAGRICNNFLVNRALFDKSMKLSTCVDL